MNILLVEDNLSIIKGLTYSFEKNNYNLAYRTNIKDTKEEVFCESIQSFYFYFIRQV